MNGERKGWLSHTPNDLNYDFVICKYADFGSNSQSLACDLLRTQLGMGEQRSGSGQGASGQGTTTGGSGKSLTGEIVSHLNPFASTGKGGRR